jgi:hypothetical protein
MSRVLIAGCRGSALWLSNNSFLSSILTEEKAPCKFCSLYTAAVLVASIAGPRSFDSKWASYTTKSARPAARKFCRELRLENSKRTFSASALLLIRLNHGVLTRYKEISLLIAYKKVGLGHSLRIFIITIESLGKVVVLATPH